MRQALYAALPVFAVLLLGGCAPAVVPGRTSDVPLNTPVPGTPLPTVAAAGPNELTVAVAANFQLAMHELAPKFEQAAGVKLKLVYGASGTFYQQIQNGAPFDVFFSADMDFPKRLADAGQGVRESVKPYAAGTLVLWAPRTTAVDVEKQGMEALAQPAVRKIALANPATAPYGAAAVAAMKQVGLYDSLQRRIVLGENVAQAAQFAQTGAADIAFLALSQALDPALKDAGRYWVAPQTMYPRIEQGVVIVKASKQPANAAKLIAFVTGAEGMAVLQRFGYEAPG